jgi:hypothetical protein
MPADECSIDAFLKLIDDMMEVSAREATLALYFHNWRLHNMGELEEPYKRLQEENKEKKDRVE